MRVSTDKELNRLAILTGLTPSYRVWLIMRSMSGSGRISKAEIANQLITSHIIKSNRNLNHILSTGNGIFWTVSDSKQIYFKSFSKISVLLTQKAYELDPYTAINNRAGVTRHYITIDRNRGNITDFKASCIALWLDGKTISQLETARMFGITRQTVASWCQRAGVKVTENYIEMPLTNGIEENPHVTHGYLIVNKDGQTVISQRLSNSYRYYRSKEGFRGSGYKARKNVNSSLSKLDSNAILSNPDTLYIHTFKELKQAEKQGHFNGDSFRYFCTGYRKLKKTKGKIGIFELCLDGFDTAPIDNRDYKAEHNPAFIQKRLQHKLFFNAKAIN